MLFNINTNIEWRIVGYLASNSGNTLPRVTTTFGGRFDNFYQTFRRMNDVIPLDIHVQRGQSCVIMPNVGWWNRGPTIGFSERLPVVLMMVVQGLDYTPPGPHPHPQV